MVQKQQKEVVTASKDHPLKRTNRIIDDYGDWLLIDVSTPKFPNASMAVDKDVFVKHKGGRIGTMIRGNNIYASCRVKGETRYFHRGIIDIPDGMVIDHKFHYPHEFIDNRRSNIRTATQQKNTMNKCMGSRNKSGVIGVHWYKANKRWWAQIGINKKTKHLGSFTDKADAIKARKDAEIKYYGEFMYGGGGIS